MEKRPGKHSLNIDIPVELYTMYAKLCVDLGITKTEGIVQYLKYLKAQGIRERRLRVLHGKSKGDFKLDGRELE